MMLKKRVKYQFLPILMIFLFLGGCSFLPKEEEVLKPPLVEPEEVSYNTEEVKRQDIVNELTNTGRFISKTQENAYLKYRGGRVSEINISLGEYVDQGDILLRLDTESLNHQLKLQEINYQKAKLTYQKAVESGADIYTIKLNQLTVEAEKIKYENLETEISKSSISAPISGRIVYRSDLEVGDYINVYEVAARIADPNNLLLSLTFEGSGARQYSLGARVDVEIENKIYKGEVVLNPTNVPSKDIQRYENTVLIELDNLPEDIKIGDYASVTYELERSDDTIVISRRNIERVGGRDYVYVLEDGIREQRFIELGIESSGKVEVTKGLEEGELIIK